MPSSATTRQTAGPGFTFEDFTAAWLMIKLLTGEALLGVGTAGHTIQSQTGAFGWQIDDLLVTAESDADACHLALSCKSNAQVSKNGLPANFVERAWKQWRDPGSPMRRETDVLVLVTRGYQETFTPQWSNIVTWCAGADPKLAVDRIRQTHNHTRIFESIESPGGTSVATDEETVELIRHLAVIPLDFQLEPSSCREDAIRKCRWLLLSGDRGEAEAVWTDLVQMATDTRVGSGTLTVSAIWAKLRTKYDLKDQPNFAGSWKALKTITLDYKANIETALPSGFVIKRRDDKTRIADSIRDQSITVVFGESGSGKSALVKEILDEDLATYNQVWFGPEQAEAATSELDRKQLQLAHPLHDVLQSSTHSNNVIVIDSAERLSADALPRIKQFIGRLVPAAGPVSEMFWRVVLISQTEGWRDRIYEMIGQPVERPLGVENITVEEVKAVLWASQGLGWLAIRDDTVAALRNLRTLGWVIQASIVFQAGSAELASPAAIASRIWDFWTEGKAAYQRLLVQLAERDAKFERSFALSEMNATDVALFQDKPAHLPLQKNSRNRIEFQHDLAADWARFQRLKELSDEIDRWAALASNPLWSGALRLFGQFLLREPAKAGTGWDHAFSILDEKGENFAADALLDALCLDPQARQYLEGRAELFFENHGKLLNRLLRRFLHIATVPSAPHESYERDRGLALYFEAKFRIPIFGLWPPMADFLYAHLQRVAELVSPTVAEVCEVWLTTTPPQLRDGVPTPWRKKLAEIALATARALQVEQGNGRYYHPGDGERPIYSATLAGGWDLPDEVATWALEMAQRLPESEEVVSKIVAANIKEKAERAKRMLSDPVFRAHEQEAAKRRSSLPPFITRSRELPAWPLGPKNKIEKSFRKVVLYTPALAPLMNLRPKLAAEIILAALIERNPTEEYYETTRLDKVGLEYGGVDSYPTAFWKGPFFSFLQIAPDVALTTLIQLVNFATERWAYQSNGTGSREPPQTALTMRDGSKNSYIGNFLVFDWTQANSHSIGQLHCGLNALERWLTLQIEQEVDVQPILERLLKEGSSLAFVGLLVNIAKYRPALLSGTLMPLLSSEELYRLDNRRLKNWQYNLAEFSMSLPGESVFNVARDWINAPYRQQSMVDFVGQIILRDKEIASFLKAVITSWDKPDEPKEAIEFAILCAQLDEANYRLRRDPETGEETVEFELPEGIKTQVAAYQNATAPKLQQLLLARQCEQALEQEAGLGERSAKFLVEVLSAAPIEDDPDDKGRQALNKLAAAATFVTCCKQWAKAHPEISRAAKSELRAAVGDIGDTPEDLHRFRHLSFDDRLKFAAHGVFYLWQHLGDTEPEWEPALLCVLTSGDRRAAGVLGSLAYRYRTELGERWSRLMELAVLWSALSMLGPGFDDPPEIGQRWQRWVQWLRSRRISGVPRGTSSVDFLSTWQRLKRLERGRWRRTFARDENRFMRSPDKRVSRGLDTDFLDNFFGWLLAVSSRPNGEQIEIGRQALLALWSYEAAYCSEHRDEHGEYHLPNQFGYNILTKLAFYAAHVQIDRAAEIWRGVLELGPAARYLVEPFVSAWFIQVRQGCDPTAFCKRWRDMIEFAMDDKWIGGGYSFYKQRILRELLGFGSESVLTNLPDAAKIVLGMRDIYHRWVRANLQREEENVAAFSLFLASEVGAALRIEGVKWLAISFKEATREQSWRHQSGTGSALVELLDTTLQDNASMLRRDQEARDALVALAAWCATRQVPAALALQERIKHLR